MCWEDDSKTRALRKSEGMSIAYICRCIVWDGVTSPAHIFRYKKGGGGKKNSDTIRCISPGFCVQNG